MNKAQLLADLAAKAGGEVLSTELVETVGKVKRYISNVFTVGADRKDGTAIAQKRNVSFYVYDEGEAGEAAYYCERRFDNPEDQAFSGSTLRDIANIFDNADTRLRMKAAILKSAWDIVNESGATANHDARIQLAGKVMLDVATYLDAFMFFASTNATVQAAGPGGATDSDLLYIVAATWNVVCQATGITSAAE